MWHSFKIGFLLCVVLPCAALPSVSAADNLGVTINARIAALQTRFNIPITYKGTNRKGNFQYEFLPPEEYPTLDRYLRLFEEELRTYPPGFFTKKKIKGIALVRRLFRGETPTEGAYSPGLRVMLFDVMRSANNEARQRHSIHHEIFHMMALHPPGFDSLSAESWSALNVNGFKYGAENLSRKATNPVNRFAPHQMGFVTDYAMVSPAEDQAEIFACLMQTKHHQLVTRWQKKDEYLRQKIDIIKAFVAVYDPEMNEDYWRGTNPS